ncbi:MAG: sugar ABC transporter ATP-binding protein [Elusimicrobia bacterium]|nr:sugar ABC transporter ATP-binding protein [Elusimicrobiota bacterium]
MSQFFLEMGNIVKEFSGVRALDGVNLKVRKGTILGLCGENGAGKSTLMKILSGVFTPDEYSGDIYINGELKKFSGTKDAEVGGVAIIHQELNLFPQLSVGENVFIGNEITHRGFIDWPKYYYETKKLFDKYGLDMDPKKLVKDIKLGQAQLVEITKALSKNAQILVLDEPTSALSDNEIEKLFHIMSMLRDSGVTLVFISHKLDEIRRICDDVVALRDGKNIGEPAPVTKMSKDDIVKAMVGRDIKTMYPRVEVSAGKKILEVKNLYVNHPFLLGEHVVKDINFSVHEGEIFGIYGLMGSGRSEVLTSMFAGFHKDDYSGEIFVNNEKKNFSLPMDAINAGLGLVTEDRKLLGLVLGLPVSQNISLAALREISNRMVINKVKERKLVNQLIQELMIKTSSPDQVVRNLSGGNQQKVVIAKWLANKPAILMLDEPTRGVDIGAKVEIYNIMNKLKTQGVAIIMVTSDLPELMGMSDKIMVMREGSNKGIFDRKDVSVEKIGAIATGNV